MWKNKNFCALIILSIVLFCSSCNSNNIKWIETSKWKLDYKGCDLYRSSLIPELKIHKDELLGETDSFFFRTLGKANRVSYSTRGKKIFYYYLAAGSQCDGNSDKTTCLTIEFESLGTARLIYIEEIQL
jgi:hypothetical protein